MIMKKLINNIGRLISMDEDLGNIEDAAIIISGEKIEWVGHHNDMPLGDYEEISANCGVVFPGLVDCHTHLVHKGYREKEFAMRSRGATYQEIQASGGGIMSTVESTRAASMEELVGDAKVRMAEAASYGTTFVEIKTGYGLNLETEMKMLKAIDELDEKGQIGDVGTFLGAHVVPEEFKTNRQKYIDIVINDMLPASLEYKLCRFSDVFVEEGAFTPDEARQIAKKSAELGYRMKLHVDQFTNVGGGELAAELNAISADHLDKTTDKGLMAMAEKDVIGVLLPGASTFMGGKPPNGRKMIDLGVKVAVASDYNPGTCPALNLVLMASNAVTEMGLTVEEAWKAITINAALAIEEEKNRGSIVPGKFADLVCFNVPDENFPLYRFATNLVEWTMKSGEILS